MFPAPKHTQTTMQDQTITLPHAAGHSIVYEKNGVAVPLFERINFVDGSYTGSKSDGSNERPFKTINAATEDALHSGNTTIFVYEYEPSSEARVYHAAVSILTSASRGLLGHLAGPEKTPRTGVYNEAVILYPGQTLTSILQFTGHPGNTGAAESPYNTYRTEGRPRIQPTASKLAASSYPSPGGKTFTAALTIKSGAGDTAVRRMHIQAEADRAHAVYMQAAGDGGKISIRNCELSGAACGVYLSLSGPVWLGNLNLSGNIISADQVDGVYAVLEGAYMNELICAGNTISAARLGLGVWIKQNARLNYLTLGGGAMQAGKNGVYVHLEGGGMGRFTVTGTDRIKCGPNDAKVRRKCGTGSHCGPTLIDGKSKEGSFALK